MGDTNMKLVEDNEIYADGTKKMINDNLKNIINKLIIIFEELEVKIKELENKVTELK